MEKAATAIDWSAFLVLVPLVGALLAFLFRRASAAIGGAAAVAVSAATLGLTVRIVKDGAARTQVGGWGPPLGIDLHADGLSALMLLMTAGVGLAITLYARSYFRANRRKAEIFWPLWLLLWTALNALFLAADIFNLYVTLELLSLSSVALTALAGGADALTGALRYLLVGLLASLAYLLGVALLYHSYATVDLSMLTARIDASPSTFAALGLITAALVLKTALFPLHFWLPPAHASAVAPVSALLSALVVKASFYLLLRLWLGPFGDVGAAVAPVLGALGAGAVLWGSLQALLQTRLKLLIAYSTVAQIGYFFIVFPLVVRGGTAAFQGSVYLGISHALAKAAMFLAAGNMMRFGGHDRIADLDRVAERLPVSVAAFALGGTSIMGLPPSGGFIGKWLLLEAAMAHGCWGTAAIIILGGALAAAYVFKVVSSAFGGGERPRRPEAVPAAMEWAALALALAAALLGLVGAQALALLDIGDPFTSVRWAGGS